MVYQDQPGGGANAYLKNLERTGPLALKIAVPLVAISVAAAVLLGTVMVSATKESVAAAYASQAKALAQLVGTGYAKDPQDRAAITTLLTDVWASIPSVRRMRVFREVDGAPVLWASTDPAEIGRYPPSLEDAEPIATGVGISHERVQNGEPLLETIEPVRSGARQIVASVAVFTSLRGRDEAVEAIRRQTVLVGTLGVASQLATLWTILFWLVLRRTARLSQAASAVAAGNLGIRLPEGQGNAGSDELFRVAREFDHMLGAVRARTNQQAALTALGQRALQGAELPSLIDDTCQLITRNLDVTHLAVLKLMPENENLLVIAGVGWKEGLVGRVTAPADPRGSLAGYTLASSEPVIITDLARETRFTAPTLTDHGIATSMSVIIPGQDRPYGVLTVHRTTVHPFSRDDVHFVQAVANTLGWAVRHKYAQEQLREARVLEMIAKNEPLESVLNTIAEMVESQRPSSLCSVLLARNKHLYHVAGRKLPTTYVSAVDGRAIGPDSLPFGQAAHLREPVIIENIAASSVWRDRDELALVHGLRACWAVPLLSAAGEALGTFAIYHQEARTPTSDDLRLMGAASYLATIAIEQHALTEKLAHQAHHDALTGLPNRILFEDRLQQAMALAQRNGQLVGLLFADLDNFKRINDTLGHQVGDRLLQYTAQRLLGRIRQSDTLARMGGDEFAVVLTGLKDPRDAADVAQKILDAFSSPFEVEGYRLFLNGSVGISLYPQDAGEPAILQRNADTAMYRAKARGANSFQFFTPEMHAEALERLELDNSLRRALDHGEFCLHFQPQFDVESRVFVGLEALVRWNHPELGLVPPARFIPMAEESGLIVPLGNWVLREACRQNAAWQRAGLPPLRVGVNVSALQFVRADFAEAVAQALRDSGLEPRWLDLELTESVVMKDVDEVGVRLAQLRQLGVHISIDDFGTGYSSLAYLQQLPIDSLKIDRSFIRAIGGTDPDTGHGPTLVKTIVSMAHSLGMEVVAEGVETTSQLEFLRGVACELGQGYLVARPMPADQIGELLRRIGGQAAA